MVNYYKYAPIVLMLMSFFFALPHQLWCVMLGLFNGLNLENIMEASTEMLDPVSHSVTADQAELVADRLLQFAQLEGAAEDHRGGRGGSASSARRSELMRKVGGGSWLRSFFIRRCYSLPGRRLFAAYMATKALYIITVCLTLWGVGVFLDISPFTYLAKILRGFTFRPEYASQFSGRFPTVTICQYTGEAVVMGKLLRLTNICVIPFNIYYDKIFAVFYVLLVVLLVLLVVSVLTWLRRCLRAREFFGKYLEDNTASNAGAGRLAAFASLDLIFVLRLIENNSDGIVTYHIVQKLNEKLMTEGKKESLV